MILSNKLGVQQLVKSLAELGLKELVICPGSRNAPLTLTFNRHPAFNCTSIRDERSAGFFALGQAIVLQEPVAVVCTSGSAALNLAPAIVEAYYQRVPLIVITADRAKAWTHQGDGQTINQTQLYANYIRKSYDLNGDSQAPESLWEINRSVSEAWQVATKVNKGPVHFNVPLSEPLYQTKVLNATLLKPFSQLQTNTILNSKDWEALKRQFETSKKVMILVGQCPKDAALNEVLIQFSQFENTIILTESTANVKHSDFIQNIDRCISTLDASIASNFMPDLLISIGDAVVSKRIKTLLRKYKPQAHWHIHPWDALMDTYQSLTLAIPLQPVSFLQNLKENLIVTTSDYKSIWQERNQNLAVQHNVFCERLEFSDFAVFKAIFDSLPLNTQVHIANSSPIRYAQLFDYSKVKSTHCNRGTSGIEGCTSTAMGAAAIQVQENFLLITGDVAFHYDSNALWLEKDIQNLNIIVINNKGGGIFRIIPGPDTLDERTSFLETSMNLNVAAIATQYQWQYLQAKDEASLKQVLPLFFQQKRTILEIFTDAEQNPKVLAAYWDFLKSKE